MTTTIFQREYSGESIIDLPEDMGNLFDDAGDIPQDQYGIHKGTFTVTVTWCDDETD